MKKKFLIIMLSLITLSSCAYAQERNFAEPIQLWLANNEAKAMSSLNIDRVLINHVSTPFAFMPLSHNIKTNPVEDTLWKIHYKVYHLLNAVTDIYAIAKKYGSGKFAILLKRARPGIWSLLSFHQIDFGISQVFAIDMRKSFYTAMLSTLELDAKRDYSLANRLLAEIKKLNDNEYRMFKQYIAYFTALYPNSPSPKIVSSFIKLAETRQFAKGIQEVLRPITAKRSMSASKTKSKSQRTEDDPLAELDKLANMDSEGNIVSNDNASDSNLLNGPTEPEVQDMFNIFE